MISSTSDAPLAQVGGLVGYTVTISNEGSSVLRDVSAVDRVPIELDVVSAAINSNVQATELGQTGRKEDIVWQVGPMTPGEVLHLRWTGKVVSLGGFDAVNDVRARSRSVVAATTSTTYLASTRVIGATNPAYHSTRTVVTYEAATSSQTGAAAAAAAASDATEPLPFTGFRVEGMVLVALALALCGSAMVFLSTPRGGRLDKAKVVVPVAALVFFTACVSSSVGPGALGPGGTPSVKGRHITKSSPAPSPVASQPSNGKQNKGHNKPGPPAVNPPGSGPIATGPTGAPAGVPSPAPSVPVQHVVAVTAADLPVEDAPVTKGSDFMTYTWDAQGGYISTSTSTRSFNSKDVSVTGILSNSSGAIHVKVAIKNLTPAKRVTATGRIRLAITGSGIAETLSSPPIDMTLTPGGTAHLEFDYALPSGTYGTNFSFVPTTH